MSGISQSVPLMIGEDLATASPEDIALWADVYRQLASFSLGAHDERLHEGYRVRLEYWRSRQRQL